MRPGNPVWPDEREVSEWREEAEMKALTFHGRRDVRVDNVPDPAIKKPTDAIVRVTSTAICG
jgi:hypothetical protein